VDLGIGVDLSVIVGGEVGVGVEARSGVEVEALEDGRVRASRSAGADIDGLLGLSATLLGQSGGRGSGYASISSVEFDLEQPGVAEVMAAYLSTGRLPEELPAGVERVGSESGWSRRKKSKTDILYWGNEYESEVRSGSYQRGEEEGTFIESSSTDADVFGIGVEYDRASQTHELRQEQGNKGGRLRSRSEYSGRGAVAQAVDDMERYESFEGTYQEYGYLPGDLTIVSEYDPDGLDQLAEKEQLIADEVQQSPCMEMADRSEAMNVAADGGGECLEFLRTNLDNQTRIGATDGIDELGRLVAEAARQDELNNTGDVDLYEAQRALAEALGLRGRLLASGLPPELSGAKELNQAIRTLSRVVEHNQASEIGEQS